MTNWPEDSELEGGDVDLNLTSLVDVVFALLIVFMVSSAAIIEQGRNDAAAGQIDLALPTGQTKSAPKSGAEVVVQVDADGNLFTQGKPTDRKTLATDVLSKLAADPTLQVRIEADNKLPYQRVMDVIGHLHDIGVRNVGLATRQPAKP